MAKKVKQDALGIKVCQALGMKPDAVCGIVLKIPVGDVPKITIDMMDFDGDLEAIDWDEELKRAEVTVNITRVTWDA